MKRIKYLMLMVIFLVSCTTKYITVPLSKPPSFYEPNNNISTSKELIKEYQRSIIKISEWQSWYNVQSGSNYYKIKGNNNGT
ncbi:hypothetical protein WESB_0300 [Brachyspira pilosicoli WesB]|uniref:Lipoprotein n=1 Tax=Brachyspira pilosicoli WesB TaxID=1161918 RepID=K0JI48_BRAPL|nr:hypothetical protein [Brachyspira pilosicoli]CCG55771.1 hypothetical protein WESB_0300 [Brachyspira pilosicoli WesB]